MAAPVHAVVWLSALCLVAAVPSGWHAVHLQAPDSAGSSASPSIRYGHTCNMYKGRMVATHGYYYDTVRGRATWLSDTWAMDAAREPHSWQRLSHHLSQSDAYDHYSQGRTPSAPCGRFGHAVAIVGDMLLLYGGHDGGYSRTNREAYRPEGNYFDELWRFDLVNHTWSRLQPEPDADGRTPGKRYLAAAAAINGRFILYGGMGPGRGDVWSYDPAGSGSGGGDGRWELLAEELPPDRGGPGGRLAHSLLSWSSFAATGAVLYGGQSSLPNGTTFLNDDAWFFDLETRAWRKLQAVGTGGSRGITPAAAGDSNHDSDTKGALEGASAPSSAPAAAAAVAAVAVTLPPGRSYHAAMATVVELPPATGCNPAAASAGRGRSRGWAIRGSVAAAAATTGGTCPGQRVRVGVIAGGTLTIPGLQCASDAWAFTLDCSATRIAWRRLPDLPAALYDTHGAAWAGSAFVFGGHLCSLEHPPHAPYPFFYVNEVVRMKLDEQWELVSWLQAGVATAAVHGGGGGGSGNGGGGDSGTQGQGNEEEAPPVCVLREGEGEGEETGPGTGSATGKMRRAAGRRPAAGEARDSKGDDGGVHSSSHGEL